MTRKRRRSHDHETIGSNDPNRVNSQGTILAPHPPEKRGRQNRHRDCEEPPQKKQQVTYTEEQKKDIYHRMQNWHEKGASKRDSPIPGIMKKYGCARKYPSRVYNKAKSKVSVADGRSTSKHARGTPPVETKVWDKMVEIIRTNRKKRVCLSCPQLQTELNKTFRGKTPSTSAIRRKKKSMGFTKHRIKSKPKLSQKLKEGRVEFARKIKSMRGKLNDVIVCDEKWFSVHKGVNAHFEARDDSDVEPEEMFRGVDHETHTQRPKVMYLAALTGSGKKIMLLKLDWVKWGKDNVNSRTGKPAKGICADFLTSEVWPKLVKAAKKEFGRNSRPTLMLDKASSHGAKKSMDYLERHFKVMLQNGKCPDMNLCDAAVFPLMERRVDATKTEDKKRIGAAVSKVWKEISVQTCQRGIARVKRNAEKVLKLGGGNYYGENRKE